MRVYLCVSAAVAILTLHGCASVKPVLRGVNDAAAILCETAYGTDQAAKAAGLSVREWCAIHKNVKPFIDEAVKAQKAAARKAGLSK